MEEIREFILDVGNYVGMGMIVVGFTAISYSLSPFTKNYRETFKSTQLMVNGQNYTLDDSIKKYIEYKNNCYPSFKGKQGRKLEEDLDEYIHEKFLDDFEPKNGLSTPYSSIIRYPVLCGALEETLERISYDEKTPLR
jgi:hypothetical protein